MEVEQWRRHFQRMAEGKIRPNHKGHYIVDDMQVGSGAREPTIRFVTPVAQDIELAKSKLKRERYSQGSKTIRKRRRGDSSETADKRRKDFSMRPPGIPAYS